MTGINSHSDMEMVATARRTVGRRGSHQKFNPDVLIRTLVPRMDGLDFLEN